MKIIVEIKADEKYCGKCEIKDDDDYQFNANRQPYCCAFYSRLELDGIKALRCSKCIKAEKEYNERSKYNVKINYKKGVFHG